MISSNAVVAVTSVTPQKPNPTVEPRLSDLTGASIQPMPDPYREREATRPPSDGEHSPRH